MAKMCFMFGHRDAPRELLPEIERAVARHYRKYGVREFVAGQYGAFDRMAAQAVRSVQKQHGDIRLLLLLPYHPAERKAINAEAYDGTIYPEGMENVPRRLAIVQANRKMAERAESMICYVAHVGNARRMLDEARMREARGLTAVENLREKSGE